MESISSVPKQSAETTIHTAGGAYISGNVVAETFIGRDQYNYYFIGLAPLVHDPTRRFRNFLNEYLGTPSQPVPFGGRQAQLEELHRWLNDVDAPPYYLMTAEAGRGKSALVCHWMEEVRQQRPEVEVIFIPISIRFETAAQDTVFAALAARLAQFYDEPLKPAALSGAQWQGVCESYLDRTPPSGKQLLIILDGLDEATGWNFGAGFFSTNPPLGLRVLVTARLRVGENTPQGWAATLGWHERLTQMVTLPPLTRSGIEEALTSMGDPLAGLADQGTIVEQLYRLTEGDPLLVRLYVQEFEKQKATVGTLNNDALQQMTPGLQGYFDQWWKGQKAQWRAQGSDPEKEEAHLRLLLDALAAALGPVTLDDLAHLHPDLDSSRLIRAQLQSVERWVIGDGKTQGYSYSHARLGYYFWEQLSRKEQAAWDERFCAWGATTLAALNAEQLDPKAAPVYLLRHYAVHLERSNAPAEAFYTLISNGWRRAWEELDISYSGFLGNVDYAWEKAKQVYAPNNPRRAEVLVQQVRAALCRSSVAALHNNMMPELLAHLVEAGLRTPMQAFAIFKLVPHRVEMIEALSAHFPAELLGEALAMVHGIENEEHRVRILSSLAPYLSSTLLNEALAIVRSIEAKDFRASALASIAPYLPKGQRSILLNEALTAVRSIENVSSRTSALGSLVRYLPVEQRHLVLTEALTDARSIKSEWSRVYALKSLAPHLPEDLCPNVLGEALTAARSIQDENSRVYALRSLAPHLSMELVAEALSAVHSIENVSSRAVVLGSLAPYLPAELISEALNTVRSIKNERPRIHALSHLAPYLPAEQRQPVLNEVLTAVCSIREISSRIKVLCHLALHLPVEQRQGILSEALNVTRSIQDEDYLAIALVRLAPYSPKELLGQTLTIARLIREESIRVEALCHLASYWPAERLGEALTATYSIQNGISRAVILQHLAPHLPIALVSKALAIARSIRDASSCAKALYQLALHLPAKQCQIILNEALIPARLVRSAFSRTKTLGRIALHLPTEQKQAVLGEALTAACLIDQENYRVDALSSLAPHLPVDLLSKALTAAYSIEHENYRADALGSLVPYLPIELLSEALTAARLIQRISSRVKALGHFIPYFPAALLDEALSAARLIEDASSHAEALGNLIPHLSTDQRQTVLSEALTVVRLIQDEYCRITVLVSLAPHLPAEQLDEALTDACSLEHVSSRTNALSHLSPHLPAERLGDVLTATHSIYDEDYRAGALRSLVPNLTAWAQQAPKPAYDALVDTLPALASRPRPQFLQDITILMPFILALAGDEAPQAAEGIYHAIQEVCAWCP